jgi:predicted DNA-binding transcriptional regulator YafY
VKRSVSNSDRTLEILFRALRGEEISVKGFADEQGVSTKSVSRDIARIKDFFSENRDLTGNAELEYDYAHKAYRFLSDEFLADKELFAVAKALLGTRAFSKRDTARIMAKFKKFTTTGDRKKLNKIVAKELLHYSEVKHYCEDVTENLWQLVKIIHENREITISYYKIDKTYSEKRIQPVSLIFMEYYFYLIAFYPDKYDEPRYFRVDRITGIVEHRQTFDTAKIPDFDEGLLRKRCQFMFYGKLRKIRFEYTGPSLQAILDRLPTARIIDRKRNTHTVEAEVHGDGIKMFLLSQGAWVKVIGPADFVREMKAEIEKMRGMYALS